MDDGVNPNAPATAAFLTTHWSLVIQAGSPASAQARPALEALCSVYWYPLYAFVRCEGNGPDQALDLTQDFFARLLEKGILTSVDQRKGGFRSFLRVACRTSSSTPGGRNAWSRPFRSRSTPAMLRAASSASRPTTGLPSGCSSATERWP